MKNIIIVSAIPVISFGLKAAIEAEIKGGVKVEIETVMGGREILEKLKNHKYDLLVVVATQLERGRKEYILLQRVVPMISTLLVTGTNEYSVVRSIFQQGLIGMVGLDQCLGELRAALKMVLAGVVQINEPFKQYLLEQMAAELSETKMLTAKESEVVMLMLEGERSIGICKRLGLRPSTVSTYKAKIFSKLGIKSIVELVRMNKETIPLNLQHR